MAAVSGTWTKVSAINALYKIELYSTTGNSDEVTSVIYASVNLNRYSFVNML